MSSTNTKDTQSPPEQRELHPIEAISWFAQNTELRSVSPHVATESDSWIITNGRGDIIAMALIEAGEIHRIGVATEYRRRGLASTLITRLQNEYGDLELLCRESLDANKFYEATGWKHVETQWGEPEDLYKWRFEDGK